MTDSDDRDPVLNRTGDEAVFVYQFQYPLGIMNGGVAKDMATMVDYLNRIGIEPFSITRVGPLI